jgi:hypothetical protein
VIDLTGLNGLDPVEHTLSDGSEPGRSYGYGNIGALVSDSVQVEISVVAFAACLGETTKTHLFTALTIAAVPLPNTSFSLPCFWYSTN